MLYTRNGTLDFPCHSQDRRIKNRAVLQNQKDHHRQDDQIDHCISQQAEQLILGCMDD
jgi:ABC-type xylose transport system substrate-binding protein